MAGFTSALSQVEKLTRVKGPKWMMHVEYLLEGQGLSGLVIYPSATKIGWLYASSRSDNVDSSRTSALPVSDQVPFAWPTLDAEETLSSSSDTMLRPPAEGDAPAATAEVSGGGEGGAATSSPKKGQPPPGESLVEAVSEGVDLADLERIAKMQASGDTKMRETLRRAADTPLSPDHPDALFHQVVATMFKTNPKRAIALMSVPESKDLVDRPAKLSKATAMMKMTISDALIPQFRNFTSPQQMFDEVLSWEVEARMSSVHILRSKLTGIKWLPMETPRDFFYRAKGYVEALALAGVTMPEWEAVGLMVAAVTQERFMYVRGLVGNLPASDLKFLVVLDLLNKADSSNMLLPVTSSCYPPYLKPSPPPHAPAYAADVFQPTGGRGAGGRGAGGRGRSGRGRGAAFGGSGGDKGLLHCSHCDRTGHLVATCYKLHPELAPGSSRPRHGRSAPPCTPAEYSSLLALLAQYQNK